MNSNEVFWMHSAVRRRIPPAIHMHTSVSYTHRHILSPTQTQSFVGIACICTYNVYFYMITKPEEQPLVNMCMLIAA